MTNKLANLADYIQQALDSWKIPGAAVAVVQGDDVLHMAGYGLRNIEAKQPVTPDTRFAIASMTKAFTSMGVALLVDEGKLEWDTPVREYFPAFKLKDPYVSDNITLRDMLSHRSGLPRHDFSWYNAPFTREQLIHNMRYHELNKTFRERWEYQNMMYVTAGYITGLVAGMTWEEFIQKRIFNVLGMNGSSISAADMQKADDYATPYRIKHQKGQTDRVEKMAFYSNEVMGPAGNIFSNLTDLVKWLKVHLNAGRSGDVQLVSAGNLAQMHKPQMIMNVDGISEKMLGTTMSAYGMGWFMLPYKGVTLIEHGGNIDGFSVNIAFVPQLNAGCIVLTNVDGKPLRDILRYEVFDRLLDQPDGEWNTKYHALFAEVEKAQDQERESTDSDRVQDTNPSHPLADYVGEYAADGYPDFAVKLEGGQLYGLGGGEWWKLDHYHYDVFELHFAKIDLHVKMTFQTDVRGAVDSVSFPIEPAVKNVIFKRKPMTLSTEAAQKLTGVYDMPFEGLMLTVRFKPEGKLFAEMTGQGETELIPYQLSDTSSQFTLKAMDNVVFEFVSEAETMVLIIKQFGATFRAPRVEG